MDPIKPTYSSAIEQIRAFHILRAQVQRVLEPYELNASQWAILGNLSKIPDGMRPTDIANLLSVKTPLITILVEPLEQRLLINRTEHTTDRRAVHLQLSTTGSKMVKKVEKELVSKGNYLFKEVSENDMKAYHRVLQAITEAAPPM